MRILAIGPTIALHIRIKTQKRIRIRIRIRNKIRIRIGIRIRIKIRIGIRIIIRIRISERSPFVACQRGFALGPPTASQIRIGISETFSQLELELKIELTLELELELELEHFEAVPLILEEISSTQLHLSVRFPHVHLLNLSLCYSIMEKQIVWGTTSIITI